MLSRRTLCLYGVVALAIVQTCSAAVGGADSAKGAAAGAPDEKLSRKERRGELTAEQEAMVKPIFTTHDPIGGVDEYQDTISPQQFWSYVQRWEPMIVRGAAKNMKGHHLWSPRYLAEKYPDVIVRGEMKVEDRRDKIPYAIPLKEFIADRKKKDFYAVSALPYDMSREVDVPGWALCGDRRYQPEYPEPKNRRWLTLMVEPGLWMSDGITKSILHYDQYNIINCILQGSKVWRLVNTRDRENMKHMKGSWATGHHDNGFIDPPPSSDYSTVNVNKVDLKKFPGYAKIKYRQVTQNAGDCLFVPYAYLHQVTKNVTGWSTAVTYMFQRAQGYSDEACKNAPIRDMPLTYYDNVWYFSGRGIVPIGYGSPENVRDELYRWASDAKKQTGKPHVSFDRFFARAQAEWGGNRDAGPLERPRVRWLWDKFVDRKKKGYIDYSDILSFTMGDLQILLGEFDYDELEPNIQYYPQPLSLKAEQQYDLSRVEADLAAEQAKCPPKTCDRKDYERLYLGKPANTTLIRSKDEPVERANI